MQCRNNAGVIVKRAAGNDHLPPAASEMRKRSPACLTEACGKASGGGQVEADNVVLSLRPPKRLWVDDRIGGVSRPARLATSRTVAVHEHLEWLGCLISHATAEAASSNDHAGVHSAAYPGPGAG